MALPRRRILFDAANRLDNEETGELANDRFVAGQLDVLANVGSAAITRVSAGT